MILLLSFFIFFCLNFFGTQIIYSKNRFFVSFLFAALALPLIFIFGFLNEKMIIVIDISLLSFYYLVLLFIIKKVYKILNDKLISLSVIDPVFADKDFTYVLWDGQLTGAGPWWNKKLTSSPSWLDHLLTMILLIIPILICTAVYSVSKI
jgi:hypothetical protein